MNKKIGRPADYIAMVVLLLMAIGTVFVFSAGANLRQGLNLRHFYEFGHLRPVLFFPLALLLMYAVSRINYRRFGLDKHWSKSPLVYSLVFSIALLIFVLLPQFGTEINFARRWLRIPLGPTTLSFQPSELAKWSLVFFLAAYCDKFNARLKLYWKGFVPICLIIGLVAGLIIIEDFGTAAFLAFLCGLILIIAGVNFRHVLTLVPFGAAGLIGAIIGSPARLRRIEAFINPEKWAGSANYQANQSLIALGSGGLFGKGLGMGISKYGHLPEDTTDFIFAIIGEELGFLGTAAVIGLFIIFIWLGILVIYRCRDRFGRFLAAGIVLTIGFQATINIGVAAVVLPTKGIPLPFISSGGTSMLLSAAAVGVLLNIARDTENTELENGRQ